MSEPVDGLRERLTRFAERIEGGQSPDEASGFEWHELAADVRSALAARQSGDPR